MTDDEFWGDVGRSLQPSGPDEPSPDDEDLDDVRALLGDECPVCGSTGACATDSEGRALIHSLNHEQED